jgi:hypothetical protein
LFIASQFETQSAFDGRLLAGKLQKYGCQPLDAKPNKIFGRDRDRFLRSHGTLLSSNHELWTVVAVCMPWVKGLG